MFQFVLKICSLSIVLEIGEITKGISTFQKKERIGSEGEREISTDRNQYLIVRLAAAWHCIHNWLGFGTSSETQRKSIMFNIWYLQTDVAFSHDLTFDYHWSDVVDLFSFRFHSLSFELIWWKLMIKKWKFIALCIYGGECNLNISPRFEFRNLIIFLFFFFCMKLNLCRVYITNLSCYFFHIEASPLNFPSDFIFFVQHFSVSNNK